MACLGTKLDYTLKPGLWLTAKQKLQRGIWPWTKGVRSRLPQHYKVKYVEAHMKEPMAVHWRKDERKYKLDEWGQRIAVVNTPIPVKYPDEADQGLWGGEGLVEGLRKKDNKPKKPSYPYMWRPQLMRLLFHSEILDRHMEIVVTRRTLDQIDEHYGFDGYIIKTHQVDLKSALGMRLKREMLMRLVTKNFLPDNPKRRDELYEMYKDYILPEEEVEWVGLTIEEAEYKQERLEEEERIQNLRPLKYKFMEELWQDIKAGKVEPEEKPGMLQKLNPFKPKSEIS